MNSFLRELFVVVAPHKATTRLSLRAGAGVLSQQTLADFNPSISTIVPLLVGCEQALLLVTLHDYARIWRATSEHPSSLLR